jgi:glycosyl-4,4'-diaponeurosporenoate acyltransferase
MSGSNGGAGKYEGGLSLQIIQLPPIITILLSIALWAIFQTAISYLCLLIKDSRLSYKSFLFKTRHWEKNGDIYDKIFKVRQWKKLLPDGGAVMKGGYKKKHLDSASKDNLEKYVLESCRGELAHLLSILPFWLFGLFAPARVVVYMLIYALLVNLPCIIAQRYNRPRFVRLLQKMEQRQENKSKGNMQ